MGKNYCKKCGKEIPPTEFDCFFEELPDTCKECAEKADAEQKKKAEEEIAKHPDWYGSVNQSEPY